MGTLANYQQNDAGVLTRMPYMLKSVITEQKIMCSDERNSQTKSFERNWQFCTENATLSPRSVMRFNADISLSQFLNDFDNLKSFFSVSKFTYIKKCLCTELTVETHSESICSIHF